MDRAKIIACLSLSLLAACSRPRAIVVGSKNFTEQLILGEIFAQQIERRLGVPVERKLDLGGTLLAQQALASGAIDLYPEYTGTALTAVLKQPPARDPAAVWKTVETEYRRRWHLEWLPPLGFNNTFAMMIRGETAKAARLATLSDAARARAWRLGTGYEFRQRPDGLEGLLKTYGLRTDGEPVTMDLGLLYAALESKRVDMIAANSTDGLAGALDLAILRDDKHYFPPYQCSAVVRAAALARFPGLRAALEQLSGKLPDAVMRKLNYEVDGRRRTPAEVASEFLNSVGLTPPGPSATLRFPTSPASARSPRPTASPGRSPTPGTLAGARSSASR
jgi:osmoprotectant transport system substrate-binding protein